MMESIARNYPKPAIHNVSAAVPQNVNRSAAALHGGEVPKTTWDSLAINHTQAPQFGKIGVLTHGRAIGIIDYEPPAGEKSPLFYVFENGFRDRFGTDKATFGIETIRSTIHQAKHIHKDSPLTPEILRERYRCDAESAKAQGWKGEFPKQLPVHQWEQLKDHVLGYPDALSDDPAVRRRGRIRGRFKLWLKGMRTTMNRVEEAASKGARTMFTSFPGQLAIGVLVASPVVAYLIISSHSSHAKNAES